MKIYPGGYAPSSETLVTQLAIEEI